VSLAGDEAIFTHLIMRCPSLPIAARHFLDKYACLFP